MLLTIGMPSYNNYKEVWFTVQALRSYHNLDDCEILIVDNFGDKNLEAWVKGNGSGKVRYELFTEVEGTAPAKNEVFSRAKGDFVLCIDSHILLAQGSVEKLKKWIQENPSCDSLIQSPMEYDFLGMYVDTLLPKWATKMFGLWGENFSQLKNEPYEIPMMGTGLLGSFREKWLGFHKDFRGFGGEEGYIHWKYQQHQRKVLCLPFLTWLHLFHIIGTEFNYPINTIDRVRNYIIGYKELGISDEALREEFGSKLIDSINSKLS
jgi:glycosyltransferase involved in cell wall biosynthesis